MDLITGSRVAAAAAAAEHMYSTSNLRSINIPASIQHNTYNIHTYADATHGARREVKPAAAAAAAASSRRCICECLFACLLACLDVFLSLALKLTAAAIS